MPQRIQLRRTKGWRKNSLSAIDAQLIGSHIGEDTDSE